MPTIAEVPQSVGADSVFKAVVKIPYKNDLKEIGADGSEVPLQVGAVVMLPDGFKLAPQERWTVYLSLICFSFRALYFIQRSLLLIHFGPNKTMNPLEKPQER